MDRCTGQHGRDCIWCSCVKQADSLGVPIYFEAAADTMRCRSNRKLSNEQLDTLLLVMDLIP